MDVVTALLSLSHRSPVGTPRRCTSRLRSVATLVWEPAIAVVKIGLKSFN